MEIKLPTTRLEAKHLSLLRSISDGTAPIETTADDRRRLHWLGLIEEKVSPPANLAELKAELRERHAEVLNLLKQRKYSAVRDNIYRLDNASRALEPKKRWFPTAKGKAILAESLNTPNGTGVSRNDTPEAKRTKKKKATV